MIGTIVNVCCIVVGSAIGSVAKRGLKPRYQNALFTALGVAVVGMGLNAVVQNMPNSSYPVLFIMSMALGSVVGTALDLEGRFNGLIAKFSNRSGSKGARDQADSDTGQDLTVDSDEDQDLAVNQAPINPGKAEASQSLSEPGQASIAGESPEASLGPDFAKGLSTAVVLFCVGTLSILGPINSALYGDETYLFTNATLDFVSSMVFGATFGFGIAAAAIVLFCWQGGIYLLAGVLAPLMGDGLMCEIAIVGGLLILASGINLLKLREISTMNLLPALFVPPVWFGIVALLSSFGVTLPF